MNEPRPVMVELSNEELNLLAAHLRRHLEDVDRELIRTENRVLQHAIAGEAKVLENVVKRLEAIKH
jgi:hypothetical protein